MTLPPIVLEMLNSLLLSVDELKEQITNVCDAGLELDDSDAEGGFSLISFNIGKKKFIGKLVGRNRELIIGMGEAFDKAIACRVFLDGDAKEI